MAAGSRGFNKDAEEPESGFYLDEGLVSNIIESPDDFPSLAVENVPQEEVSLINWPENGYLADYAI